MDNKNQAVPFLPWKGLVCKHMRYYWLPPCCIQSTRDLGACERNRILIKSNEDNE